MPDIAAQPTARRRSAPLSQAREKLFYSISEAATQLDVAAHVLLAASGVATGSLATAVARRERERGETDDE